MPIKFETLLKKWSDRYPEGAEPKESLDDYIARMARTLVQTRRWAWLRQEVWKRDNGFCNVCWSLQSFVEYELGHIVDRVVGGKDEMDNLVVMCAPCNRMKPFHHSKEEYEAWIAQYRARVEEVLRLIKPDFSK
jgi:5-methylcytosine-specific restriction endonuclease McrA